MTNGLKSSGVLYFTLFGPRDGWAGKRPELSFIEHSEILEVLAELPLKIHFQAIEEGYGPLMSGDIKYWHIFRFLCLKQ